MAKSTLSKVYDTEISDTQDTPKSCLSLYKNNNIYFKINLHIFGTITEQNIHWYFLIECLIGNMWFLDQNL